MTPRCEVCGGEVDINGLCRKGCYDEFDLEPLPPRRTARDRFRNRVR